MKKLSLSLTESIVNVTHIITAVDNIKCIYFLVYWILNKDTIEFECNFKILHEKNIIRKKVSAMSFLLRQRLRGVME